MSIGTSPVGHHVLDRDVKENVVDDRIAELNIVENGERLRGVARIIVAGDENHE
jgi:hypothetical protein